MSLLHSHMAKLPFETEQVAINAPKKTLRYSMHQSVLWTRLFACYSEEKIGIDRVDTLPTDQRNTDIVRLSTTAWSSLLA